MQIPHNVEEGTTLWSLTLHPNTKNSLKDLLPHNLSNLTVKRAALPYRLRDSGFSRTTISFIKAQDSGNQRSDDYPLVLCTLVPMTIEQMVLDIDIATVGYLLVEGPNSINISGEFKRLRSDEKSDGEITTELTVRGFAHLLGRLLLLEGSQTIASQRAPSTPHDTKKAYEKTRDPRIRQPSASVERNSKDTSTMGAQYISSKVSQEPSTVRSYSRKTDSLSRLGTNILISVNFEESTRVPTGPIGSFTRAPTQPMGCQRKHDTATYRKDYRPSPYSSSYRVPMASPRSNVNGLYDRA
ncbi:hypothetical protein FB446DRAFT_794256 [Lentinula raphanica]|nr:hypothetical protein FB446DRAFT_794256 [Lentinula raphanica]